MATVSPEIEQVVSRGLQATKRYLSTLHGQDYINAVGEIAILDTIRALPFSIKQVCEFKPIPVGMKEQISNVDFTPELFDKCKDGIEDIVNDKHEPSHVHMHIHLPQTFDDEQKEIHIHVHTGDKELEEYSFTTESVKRGNTQTELNKQIDIQPGFVLSIPNTPNANHTPQSHNSTPVVKKSVWTKSTQREQTYTESELIRLDFDTARDYIHKVKTTKGERAYLDLMEILINNECALKYPLSTMANEFEVTAQRILVHPFDANSPFPIY